MEVACASAGMQTGAAVYRAAGSASAGETLTNVMSVPSMRVSGEVGTGVSSEVSIGGPSCLPGEGP